METSGRHVMSVVDGQEDHQAGREGPMDSQMRTQETMPGLHRRTGAHRAVPGHQQDARRQAGGSPASSWSVVGPRMARRCQAQANKVHPAAHSTGDICWWSASSGRVNVSSVGSALVR